MNYKIRKVKVSDFEKFNDFCFEMYSKKSQQFLLEYVEPPSTIYTKKQFLEEIGSRLEINLIALKNDEIIGFIQADIKSAEETHCMKSYKFADIRNFYVREEHDSDEIRKKMFAKVEQSARTRSLDKIAVMNLGELLSDNFYLQQSFYPFCINYVKCLN